MWIFRLLVGALYDIGRLMAAVSFFYGLVYLAMGIVHDNPSEGATAVTHFVFGILFGIIARIFRRYAI